VHDGDLTAVGEISIARKNTINGQVRSAEEVDSDGTVNGAVQENAFVGPVIIPSVDVSARGEDIDVPKEGSRSLTEDSYGEAKVGKEATLSLSSGTYFFESLKLGKEATLLLDVTLGEVVINIEDKLEFGKNMRVEITPGGEAASQLVTFNYEDKRKVKIKKGAVVLGTIIAPNALVRLDKNSRFKGIICAEEIQAKKGSIFLRHSATTWLPKTVAMEDDDNEVESDGFEALPTEFELSQNYPNPFNPSTTISFALPEAGEVSLKIYNLRGQLVATLHQGAIAAGRHQMVWDGKDAKGQQVATGVYVYRLEADGFVATKKLMLMK
jgi:choice-of-anchor A domain-containing protein